MAQRGRIGLAILAALALVGATAAALWWFFAREKPIEGSLVALLPVDAERAVVCVRADYDDHPPRAWIALAHRSQGLVWKSELSAMPAGGPRAGMTVAGGVVTVRTARDEKTLEGLAAVGYSLQSGALLWEFDLASGLDAPQPGSGPFASPALHIETLETAAGLVAIALERQTGALAWRRLDAEHGRNLEGARLLAAHLLSEPVAETLFYSTADGSPPLELESRGPGCLLADRYYVLGTPADDAGEEPDAVNLVSFALSPRGLLAPRFRPLVLPWIKGASAHVKVEACGVHQGKLVYTYTRAREGTADGLELVALDPETAEIAWHFDVGAVNLRPSQHQAIIHADYRANFPLSGELPRFVAVLLDEEREGNHTRLALLDLEEQRIVREGPQRHELIHAAVFKVGSTSYVVGRLSGPFLVAALDGATGELHAVHLYGSYAEVWPYHVYDGTLWVYSSEWRRIERAPWAALDAATLTTIHDNGMVIGIADDAALAILDADAHPQKGRR